MNRMRIGLLGLVLSCFTAEAAIQDEVDRLSISTAESIEDVFAYYEEQQEHYIGVLLPNAEPLEQSATEPLPITTKYFDQALLTALEGSSEEIFSGVWGWRITISQQLNKNGRSVRKITGIDGVLLAKQRLPKSYNPYSWIESSRSDFVELSSEEQDALRAHHDPARIEIEVLLLPEEDLEAYVLAKEQAELAAQPLFPMMRTVSAPLDPGFSFTAVATGSNDLEFTLNCPSGVTNVGIVASTNMQDWTLFNTATVSGGSLLIAEANSSNMPNHQLYGATDLDFDNDLDGRSDGFEYFLDNTSHLDPDDPANIAGSVSYDTFSGGQSGTIYVLLETSSSGWSTNRSQALSQPSSFHLTQIPHGTYYLKAFRDSNGNGTLDTYEARGTFGANPVFITGQIVNADFVMTDPDTDGDQMGDWWEKIYFVVPTIGIAEQDDDVDSLKNLYEYYAGTSPVDTAIDTDGDGMSDDFETYYNLDLNVKDANADADGDGFTNIQEMNAGTNPRDPYDFSGGIYVSPDGSDNIALSEVSYNNPFKTIAHAIDQALSGDIVILHRGEYSESDLSISKNITLTGIAGYTEETVINAQSNERCLSITNAITNTIAHITFTGGLTDQTDYYDGGAIFCEEAMLTITDCLFKNNQAGENYGGALAAGNNANVTVIRSIFTGNSAVCGGAAAGADFEALAFDCCLFEGNSATNGGSAYYEEDFTSCDTAVSFTACTIHETNEQCEALSLNITDGNDVRARLESCIIWGDQSIVPDTELIISNSCIQGWVENAGSNIITNDPQFAANGRNLSPASPCIDTGMDQAITCCDLDGRNRPFGAAVDMGAYEFRAFKVDVNNTTPQSPYSTWDTASTNIQNALEFAIEQDIVLVTNGIYNTGSARSQDGTDNRIVIPSGVTVESINGAEVTVIEGAGPRGEHAVRCAYLGPEATLKGVTLDSGHTPNSGNTLSQSGGGAFLSKGSHLESCAIIGCEAEQGGALYMVSGSTAAWCRIEDNSAVQGGGVCLEGDALLRNSILDSCSATGLGGGAHGGRMRCSLVVANNASDGAGLYDCYVENCTIVSNIATLGSGGISGGIMVNSISYYNTPSNWSDTICTNSCTIRTNGSAILMPAGEGNITNAPVFKDRANSVYELSSFSPCINTGLTLSWMQEGQDLSGLPFNAYHNVPDVGAYSFNLVRPGFDLSRLEVSDDGYTHNGTNNNHDEGGYELIGGNEKTVVPLGFTVDFFGTITNEVYINMNGNISFGEINPMAWTNIYTFSTPFIAPFWADVDARFEGEDDDDSWVHYGRRLVDGHTAFAVTWYDVTHCRNPVVARDSSKLNTFQLVMIDRSDKEVGDFDLEFNYATIEWETGYFYGGSQTGFGGDSARIGWYGGSIFNEFWFPGSAVPGTFFDTGTEPLKDGSFGHDLQGRYLFQFRDGQPCTIKRNDDMEDDPGWTLESPAWTYGYIHIGDKDPASFLNGSKALVNNEDGWKYVNFTSAYATMPAFDATTFSNVFLSCYAWLSLKDNGDQATIEVSKDGGSSWDVVWDIAGSKMYDSWMPMSFNLTDELGASTNALIRFGLNSDYDLVSGGWNLDEVRLLELNTE